MCPHRLAKVRAPWNCWTFVAPSMSSRSTLIVTVSMPARPTQWALLKDRDQALFTIVAPVPSTHRCPQEIWNKWEGGRMGR